MNAIEEVLCANTCLLYPNAVVEAAYLLRVTRGGDLHLHDDHVHDLVIAVASATKRRPHNPTVRVEVEASMPEHVSARILDNVRRVALGRKTEITVNAIEVIDGLLDRRCLQSPPLPNHPELEFPSLCMQPVVAEGTSMLDTIDRGDLLLQRCLDDATAWELDGSGAYHRRDAQTGAQAQFAADLRVR